MRARRSLLIKIASSGVALAVAGLVTGGCDPSPEDINAAVAEACNQLSGPATAKAMEKIADCLAGMDQTPSSQACITDSGNAPVCTTCERKVLDPCSFDSVVKLSSNVSVAGYTATAEFNLHISATATQEVAEVKSASYSGPLTTDAVTYMARYAKVKTTFSNGVVGSVTGSLPISAGFAFTCQVESNVKSFGKKSTSSTTCGSEVGQLPGKDSTTTSSGDQTPAAGI